MNVEKTEWEQKLHNLHTRQNGITSEHQINYPELLKLVRIGATVLDVGCGTMWLKKLMPKGTIYNGLDANENIINRSFCVHGQIETIKLNDNSFDTIFIFAALDGMQDLLKALNNIKRIAAVNVVILTGIEIEPDQYHTHKITERFLIDTMAPFKCTLKKYVHPKIAFFEFIKA